MPEIINPICPDLLPRMDPQFVELYNKYIGPYPRADQTTIEEYRKNPAKYTFPTGPLEGPSPPTGSDTIYKVPVKNPDGEIPVQVFVPTKESIEKNGMAKSKGKLPIYNLITLPAHINYHGGGWVIGSLKSDESWCRQACEKAGVIIVNVDYRLAPEYPYPVCIWDSYAALTWTFDNASKLGIDSSRVGIGGLSAGGHLSAVMALLARDNNLPPLKLQMLLVGAFDSRYIPIDLDASTAEDDPYPSHKEMQYAPCLPMHRMVWFSNLWLGKDPEQRKKNAAEWYASPMLAPSHKNLAPASFHIAEIDPLYSQELAYHELLLKNGNSSVTTIYKGVAHPFAHADGALDKAKEYLENSVKDMKKYYAP